MEDYQVFKQFPNWKSGISIKYSMLSSIISSARYKEQRKALRDVPYISETFQIFLEASSTVFNRLIACLQKVMLVPVFTERFDILSTGMDLSALTVADTSNMYYARSGRAGNVLIIDRVNGIYINGETPIMNMPRNTELLVIDDGQITIDPISYSYIPGNALAFPLMPAMLSTINKISESAKQDTYELTFDEFVEESPI